MKARLLTLLIAAALLAGCAGSPAVEETSGLRVVATTTILADVVKQVGGEHVSVSALLPVGIDPHTFQPAPQDITRTAEAEIVFIVGSGLEEDFISRLLENAGAVERVVSVSDNLELLPAPSSDPDHPAEADPHVWFDPTYVAAWLEPVERALSAADPEHAEQFAANAAAYRAELEALDAWIAEQVSSVPPPNRKLVTDHAVLGYFAARYGFEQFGAVIPGASSAAQPSARDLALLEDAIRAAGVPAIFTGSTTNPALARQVAADAGAEIIPFYTDSLSEPGGEAASYLDFMRANVRAIVNGLGGTSQ